MARYYTVDEWYCEKRMHTYGKKPYTRLTADEKTTKKRLGNPILWQQLEAISRGRKVNHLGRGHTRPTSERP